MVASRAGVPCLHWLPARSRGFLMSSHTRSVLAGETNSCKTHAMKISRLVLLATALLGTARAAESPLGLLFPMDSGPELTGVVSITSSADGTWKPLKESLQKTEDGFQGTLTTPEGKEIKIEGHYKKTGAKWECSIKWESESDTPLLFIAAHYLFTTDQLKEATITSGKGGVVFEKMIDREPTGNVVSGVSEFTLGPVEGATFHFTLPESTLVEAVLIGDNIHVRTFLTPTHETLPASGTVEWTVEKQ